MLRRREFVLGALGTVAVGTALWSRDGGGSQGIGGAHGDGVSDDTKAVALALARAATNGVAVDGGDRVYAVRGDLQLTGAVRPWVKSLRLKQLAPASDRKTLHFENCQEIRIDRLEIDRGSAANAGVIGSSAGLWIDGGSGHQVRNVEVFGDGAGNGIAIWNVRNGSFDGCRVRDMRFDAPSANDDILQGIWLNRTEDCALSNASVSNLFGNADRSLPARYTRGIAVGGSRRLKIINPRVRGVDQGIDITGSEGNLHCIVSGGRTSQCTTVGVKLANSAVSCSVTDHVDEGAGMFGFHATGPAEPNLPYKIHDCDFVRCTAINPGANRFPFPDRPPKGPCGFLVWTGDYDQSFPAGIRFTDCDAEDRQAVRTMRYGFYCAVKPSRASTRPNEIINCTSEGHILGFKGGTWT